jgi:DNA-binding SARP family transcriptional activator
MNNIYSSLVQDQIADLNAPIIVVHPNYRGQRTVIWKLMDLPHTVYHRFDGTDLTLQAAQQQLDETISVQAASDLSNVNTMILDECDNLEADALDTFVASLSKTFLDESNNKRLILFARVVPRFIWHNLDQQYMMTMIPTDTELMLCDYVRDADAPALLEVHAFGEGRVLLNGTEITQWDGHLPRALFFYVVDRGMTTRNDIFEIFWPNLPVREATNVFHVTKRKVNEVLGIDLTSYWSGYYRISPDIELVYDAMNFSKLVQEAGVANRDQVRNTLTRAVSLYRGQFLRSLDAPWVSERRTALLQTYGEALVALANTSDNPNETEHALGLYLRSALTNPNREELVEHIMRLYEELGMFDDALTAYDRLCVELKQIEDADPTPELQQIAEGIRAKQSA